MTISGLTVIYGTRTLYEDFSMTFEDRSTTVILGPSGCGKTTLLNSIALEKNNARVSYIFQEPRLLPWCTLEKNIMLALRGTAIQDAARQERTGRSAERENRDRALTYLEKVGLIKRAGEFPGKLSGGERQRAAIARAFSFPAPVLLMDEPFQSQDPALKEQLIDLVRTLQAEEKRTVIAVTHDIREAAALADRAVILNGSPVRVILDIPADAGFERLLSEVLACQTSAC